MDGWKGDVAVTQRLTWFALLMAATALSACGGGGGGGGTPLPPPTTAPVPPPPQTPPPPTIPPETFNTAEFQRNPGLPRINPIPAYTRGATGSGVTVGIIDSGIDRDSAEFAGRIHPASRDVAGSRTIQDEDGHGTWVSAVIGAARNNSGMHGVAYESTLLIARADTAGSCADDECSFPDSAIAAGLDLSSTNNARAINISLGGSQASTQLSSAVDRATSRGSIIVISAGNDGEADPDPFAQMASAPGAKNLVIIVGAVDGSNNISSFSNRAGVARNFYVVAPGENIIVPTIGGTLVRTSGTSLAAPHVTGAVTLLADAFPNLTAAQIVDLLYRTTTDLGDPGIDAVYGRGLINIGRAFEPQGQTALAGSAQPVTLTGTNVSLGSAFGDGGQLGQALSDTVILDMYDRAYAVDLSTTIRSSAPGLGLARRLALQSRRGGGQIGSESTLMSFAGSTMTESAAWHRLGLTDSGWAQAQQPGADGWVRFDLTKESRLAFGYGRGLDELLTATSDDAQASMPYLTFRGREGEAFGVAADPLVTAAVSTPLGKWRWSMAASRTELDRDLRANPQLAQSDAKISTVKSTLSRPLAGGDIAFSFGWIGETGSVLGSRSAGAFGLDAGAKTVTTGLSARFPLSRRWSAGADAEIGRSRIDARNAALLTPEGNIWTSMWRLDLTGSSLWRSGDKFGLMLAQPLRVEQAKAHITLPVGYAYGVGVTEQRSTTVNLAPSGREIDLEAAYMLPLGERARLSTHMFHRFDAAHGAAGQDDTGVVLRLSIFR